jgi:repressor LexA
VKRPDCTVVVELCEMSHMSSFDMDAFRARLQRLMDERKVARKPLAKAAGLGETALRDIFEPERRDVRVGTLVKLADYFEVSLDDLIGEPAVRLAGRIGAGGEVIFEPEEDPDAPGVPRPPGASGRIMALQVVGISMLPKYEDGDIVYVNRDIDGIPKNAIGEYCAIRTADGGTYLKILAKGTVPGRYTLRSLNAADMEDQEVVWAAPVRWVMQQPRGQR